MLQTRTRQMGVGKKSKNLASNFSSVYSFRLTVAFHNTYEERTSKKGLTEKQATVSWNGLSVVLYSPTTYASASTGFWYYTFSNDWAQAQIARIKAAFDPDLVRVKLNDGKAVLTGVDTTTTTDTTGSKFRQLKGKEAVVNPYSSTSIRGNFPVGTAGKKSVEVTNHFAGSLQEAYQSYHFDVKVTVPVSAGVSNAAYNWLLAQAQSFVPLTSSAASLHASAVYDLQQGDMDLLTSLAEMNKTISYVVGRLKDIAHIISCVRRKDFSFLRKAIPVNADPWLEARYAIRPLIIDAENAIRAFNNTGALVVLKRASRHESIDETHAVSGTFSDSDFSYSFSGNVVVTGVRKGGAIGKLSADLPNLYKLGMFNFATTAVELIPWSFVFQWFVNMSGLLASLNPNPVYELQSGYTSVRAEVQVIGDLTAQYAGSNVVIPISLYYKSNQRTVQKHAALLALDVNLNVPKLADLIAFVTKRF